MRQLPSIWNFCLKVHSSGWNFVSVCSSHNFHLPTKLNRVYKRLERVRLWMFSLNFKRYIFCLQILCSLYSSYFRYYCRLMGLQFLWTFWSMIETVYPLSRKAYVFSGFRQLWIEEVTIWRMVIKSIFWFIVTALTLIAWFVIAPSSIWFLSVANGCGFWYIHLYCTLWFCNISLHVLFLRHPLH